MVNTDKFKVGQLLRCITCSRPRISAGEDNPGGGWKEGLEFKTNRISYSHQQIPIPIYWGAKGGSGVYEDFLELVTTEWNTENNK